MISVMKSLETSNDIKKEMKICFYGHTLTHFCS